MKKSIPRHQALKTASALFLGLVFLTMSALHAQAALSPPRSTVSDSVRLTDPAVQSAVALWKKQVETLRTGEEKKIAGFWNKIEAERGVVHDQRYESLQKYRATIRRLSDKIVDAAAVEDGCIRLTIHWLKEPDAKPFAEETVFVFQEKDKPVLGHALAAFTRSWQSRKTKYFVFRYPAGAPLDQGRMARVDDLVRSFSERLQMKPGPAIPYFAFPHPFDLSQLKKWGLSKTDLGEALGRLDMVADWGRNSGLADHEIIHVLQSRLHATPPCVFLLEGTAVYFGGDAVPPDSLYRALKRGLGRSSAPSLDAAIRQSNVNWHETQAGEQWLKAMGAASVGYLNETRSVESFRSFYKEASSGLHQNEPEVDMIDALKNVYGLTVPELEQGVRSWLAQKTD
jgi:hypothetical protein